MLGTGVRHRRNLARGVLAAGLVVSAGLLITLGGWPGLVFGLAQLSVSAAMTMRWKSVWPPAWAVLALIPGPVAAARHWTVRLPGACQCARLAHPPPALVSLTGLVVLIDLGLLALAVALTAANRRPKVEKSSA